MMIKHGLWKTKEYNTWQHMKGRCYNPNHFRYPQYGAKGVTVYKEWVDSFESFIKYVGFAPSPKHTLDRYPNKKGNYEPGNVRWATPTEQSRNTKKNRNIIYNGVEKTLTEWATEIGIDKSTLSNRLRGGLSEYAAIKAGRIRKMP